MTAQQIAAFAAPIVAWIILTEVANLLVWYAGKHATPLGSLLGVIGSALLARAAARGQTPPPGAPAVVLLALACASTLACSGKQLPPGVSTEVNAFGVDMKASTAPSARPWVPQPAPTCSAFVLVQVAPGLAVTADGGAK